MFPFDQLVNLRNLIACLGNLIADFDSFITSVSESDACGIAGVHVNGYNRD